MSEHFHALIWIDHREAKVFLFDADNFDPTLIRSAHPDRHIHHKVNPSGNGHAPLDKTFFKRVAQAVGKAGAILITGPANAKTELVTYINSTVPDLGGRISGVESLEHPTDRALVALARTFFRADDRMYSQSER